MGKKSHEQEDKLEVRLDKWLHSARFYKTRSIATQMVDGGKVAYNGQRVKPSKLVELGAEITLQKGNEKITVTVQELSNRRTAYKVAQHYYAETAESIVKREQRAEQRRIEQLTYQAPSTKPNKKERRTLNRFKLDIAGLDNYK